MDICVYGVSSAQLEQSYYDRTEELGRMMAKRGHGLVFGGGATCMMNALAYLFEREEIPPEAIRNMMLYCLDCHSKEGIPGKRGTSRAAMMFLSNWLNEYGELGIMSVSSEYLSG